MPFDPNKPYEIVGEDSASGFDPSKPFEIIGEVGAPSSGFDPNKPYEVIGEVSKPAYAAPKAVPTADGRAAALSVYPNLRITDNVRDPNSPLGRKNPHSWHVKSKGAIDAEAIPGMTFEEYVDGFRKAGYDIIQAKDEYNDPSPWATGPHWHVVLGEKAPAEEPEVVEPPKPVNQDVLIERPIRKEDALDVTDPSAILSQDEKEQRDFIQNEVYYGAKEGKTNEEIKATIFAKYPQLESQSANFDWYADAYRSGDYKLGIDFNSPKTEQAPIDPDQPRLENPAPEGRWDRFARKLDETTGKVGDSFISNVQRLGMEAVLSDEAWAKEESKLNEEKAWQDRKNEVIDAQSNIGTGDKFLVDLAAEMIGGVSPTYAINPGVTAAGRIASQAAIAGAEDLALQSNAVNSEGVDLKQTLFNMVAGGAFQGLEEGLSKVGKIASERLGKPVEEIKESDIIRSDIEQAVELPPTDFRKTETAAVTGENAYNPDKLQVKGMPSEEKLALKEPVPFEEEFPTLPLKERTAAVSSKVDELTAEWQNKPNVNIAETWDDLPLTVRNRVPKSKAGDALGFVLDGKVHILAGNVMNADEIPAVLFHESLGHVGLRNKFGQDLDQMLMEMARTNNDLRNAANNWLLENKGVYRGKDRVARAIEEVLAERSEKGALAPSIKDKFVRFIREWMRNLEVRGRRLDLRLTDGEVREILRQAHRTVTHGEGLAEGVKGRSKVRFISRGQKAANDNRITSRDRPSYPTDKSDESLAEYHYAKQRYHEAKAKQYEEAGKLRSAEQERHSAFLEQDAARRRDPAYERGPKDSLDYFKHMAEHVEKKLKERAARGDGPGVKRYSAELQNYREKIAEIGRLSLKADKDGKLPSDGPRFMIKKELPTTKVADADGNPRVVYHGTSKDNGFKHFKTGKRGVWFTEDPETASSYAFENDSQGFKNVPVKGNPWNMEQTNTASRVAPVYLDIKNPKVFSPKEIGDATYAKGGENYAKGQRALFDELKEQGYDGVKIEEGDGKNTWVVFDKDQIHSATTDKPGAVYMLNPRDRAKNKAGLKNISTSEQVKATLDEIAAELPKETVSHEDTVFLAKYLGMNKKQAQKLTVGMDAAHVTAMRMMVEQSAESVVKKTEKVSKVGAKPADVEKLRMAIVQHTALQHHLTKQASELGRALNALKIDIVGGDWSATQQRAMRKLLKNVDLGMLDNDEYVLKIAKDLNDVKDNPDLALSILRNATKPLWEDYIISGRQSMMLFGWKTHVKNIVGNVLSMQMDNAERLLASAFGRLRGAEEGDRHSMRQSLLRHVYMLESLVEGTTWANAATSFKNSHPHHAVNKFEDGAVMFKGAAAPLQLPYKALAAEDSLFRSMIENANFKELAYYEAKKEGLKGAEFWDRVDELRKNPTKEMAEESNRVTSILQYVDEPSAFGRKLNQLKARPNANTKSGELGLRTVRFAVSMIAPFTNVTDRLLMSAVRRTPLAVFDSVTRADFRAGGKRADLAAARLLMGATLITMFWNMAGNGYLTGEEPDRNKAAMDELRGVQPNSFRLPGSDTWQSFQGLDQLGIIAGITANLRKKYDDYEMTDTEFAEELVGIMGGAAKQLANNSSVESIAQFFSILGEGSLGENARENYTANMATSFIPNFLRQANQTFGDKQIRDSTGDGGYIDKTVGKMKSVVPGLSDDLPQRYGILGDPLTRHGDTALGILNEREQNNDPVVAELYRLQQEANEGKPLLSTADRGDLKSLGFDSKNPADASLVQEFQRLSGERIKESLTELFNRPGYAGMNDAQKMKLIDKVSSRARKIARRELKQMMESGE